MTYANYTAKAYHRQTVQILSESIGAHYTDGWKKAKMRKVENTASSICNVEKQKQNINECIFHILMKAPNGWPISTCCK